MSTCIHKSSLFAFAIALACLQIPAWGQSNSANQSQQNRSSSQQRNDQPQYRDQLSDDSTSRRSFSDQSGQKEDREPEGQRTGQGQSRRQTGSSGRQSSDRQSSDRQSSQRQQSSMSQNRQAALSHFKAGYYAGYRAGYVDAQDDYVVWMIDLQKLRRGQQASNEQGMASSDRQRLRDEMRRSSGSRSSASRTASQQRVRGEVLRTKQVSLRNTQQKHTVALVETNEGSRRIIDLGPSRELQNVQVKEGQQISVRGRFARTRDNVPVLLAQRLETNGQSVSIDRSRSQQQTSGSSQSQRQASGSSSGQQHRSAEESSNSSNRR